MSYNVDIVTDWNLLPEKIKEEFESPDYFDSGSVLIIYQDGKIIRSEYDRQMEPEDATFTRELDWVQKELCRAYLLGRKEGKEITHMHVYYCRYCDFVSEPNIAMNTTCPDCKNTGLMHLSGTAVEVKEALQKGKGVGYCIDKHNSVILTDRLKSVETRVSFLESKMFPEGVEWET